MNENIRIRMAEREGWVNIRHNIGLCGDNGYARNVCLPTYDNDNDLDGYIRGMEHSILFNYMRALNFIVTGGRFTTMEVLFQATVAQKLEAIIEAEGWK